VQSSIDEGRLPFTEESKMIHHTDTFPTNVIDFQNKKMLIRSDHTVFARGKNIVVDANALPRMIKPKHPAVGEWKINGGKTQAQSIKPTVNMLLEKYTSRKDANVFNRLGGNRRPKFPSRPGGNERWRKKSYDQQPYFRMASTYWRGLPAMHHQYPLWGFNASAPYSTGPAGYFQPGWIPSRHAFSPDMHAKKAHFRNKTRSHDAIVNHGSRSPIFKADGRSYKSSRKFIWVPVKPTGDKVDCSIVNLPATRSNGSNTDHGMKSSDQKIADDDSGVQQQQRGIDVLQKKPTLKPSLQVGNGKKSLYT
jgi:hypothetical protein